jgi:hypothetical protein
MDEPKTGEGASQWMKDVNDTLDILSDENVSIKKQLSQHMIGIAVIGGIAGLEGIGLATLFKTQKSIVETLQQIVNAIPQAPMTPEQAYRAEQAMANAKREPMKVDTEEPSVVADPVATTATEAPEWAKHAMMDDPSWTDLIEGPTDGD